ncbi:MAG TPA: hypothetical protein VN514_11520 [Ignavibacteria bacterium]|nr:hypothetical protein [Ignavibacteria bacterium]
MFLAADIHNLDEVLKTGKIITGLIIILSFFVMISAEYHHSHSDGHSHKECPVCVLNANADVSAVITVEVSEIPFYEFSHFVLHGYQSDIQDSSLEKICFGRAPPSL